MNDEHSLANCYAELFGTVFAFKAASPTERPAYETLRPRLERLLNEGRRCVDETGADSRHYAHYAAVALVDETMMSNEWSGMEAWKKEPLQVQLFGNFLAGEQFFDRLDELLRNADLPLLEVYYICLAGGLRGMYRDDLSALATRRRRSYQQLEKVEVADDKHLTEGAYGRVLERSLTRSRFPVWWLLPFVGGAAVLYLFFYLALAQQVGYIVRLVD